MALWRHRCNELGKRRRITEFSLGRFEAVKQDWKGAKQEVILASIQTLTV